MPIGHGRNAGLERDPIGFGIDEFHGVFVTHWPKGGDIINHWDQDVIMELLKKGSRSEDVLPEDLKAAKTLENDFT